MSFVRVMAAGGPWTQCCCMTFVTTSVGALLTLSSFVVGSVTPVQRLEFNAEESRRVADAAQRDVTGKLIQDGGLDEVVTGFVRSLPDIADEKLVEAASDTGRRLWSTARALAQTVDSTYEDRGLYWARLSARIALKERTETPSAMVGRALAALESESRGMGGNRFGSDKNVRRVFISGFDPFGLDENTLTISNPSGAAALSFDGTTIDTPTGQVQFQSVIFPVTWSAFDAGVVEDAFGPVLRPSESDADIIITLSQGRLGFDIEQWAGGYRGGAADNLGTGAVQDIPTAPSSSGWPQPSIHAEFIPTTLPYQAILDADTGPHPVTYNRQYCAAPTSLRAPGERICAEGNQAPSDWFAVEGSGGDFLSNESMYRANRLRLALDRFDIPGGHLHVPFIGAPIDDVFPDLTTSRRAIVDQTLRIILTATETD